MEITVEQLQERMKLLIDQRDKVLIDVHALGGAIQDCEFWIARLQKVDDKEEKV